jgi:hypothetical protein
MKLPKVLIRRLDDGRWEVVRENRPAIGRPNPNLSVLAGGLANEAAAEDWARNYLRHQVIAQNLPAPREIVLLQAEIDAALTEAGLDIIQVPTVEEL